MSLFTICPSCDNLVQVPYQQRSIAALRPSLGYHAHQEPEEDVSMEVCEEAAAEAALRALGRRLLEGYTSTLGPKKSSMVLYSYIDMDILGNIHLIRAVYNSCPH